MQKQMDEKEKENQRINQLIKDFFKYKKFDNAQECFDAEIKTKKFIKSKNKPSQGQKEPILNRMIRGESYQTLKEENKKRDIKERRKRYQNLLQAGRQVFSIAINCL